MASFLKYGLLALITCLPLFTAQAQDGHSQALDLSLPDMGESSDTVISPHEEQRLGESFMRMIRQQLTVVDDPLINDYIRSLGYKLASNSDNQSQDFTFFVVEDPTINAFAAPGGYIGVNTGLILATESESELASVLAHEIAHVTQHHLARSFEKAGRMSLPATAALIAALIIASQSSEAGQAAIAATQAGVAQTQINFTRANEEEADRVGLRILANSGFDPRSMPVFFERLQQSARFSGPQLPEYLSTHPVTASRISDTRNRAEQYAYKQIKDSQAYHLLRGKLRVTNQDNHKQTVRDFENALEHGQYRNEQGERYGYALALLANSDYDAARVEAEKLLTEDEESIPYQVLLARIEMAGGNVSDALTIYAKTLDLYPGNHPLTLLYGRALLDTGQPDQAHDLLREHARHQAPDPELYRLLAQASGEAGFKVEGHQALAEYYYLNGQTDAAIEQLTIALRQEETDFYQASEIDARLKEFREQARLAAQR